MKNYDFTESSGTGTVGYDAWRLMAVSAITVGERHRKDMGDLAGFAKGIEKIGLLHPIVVDTHGVLIAGERRLRACSEVLGWTEVPVRVVDLKEIVLGEFAENSERKNFLPSEIDAIRRRVEPALKREATIRKLSGRSAPDAGATRDKIGTFAGMSGRTVDKIAVVCQAAEEDPEKLGKFKESMDRTGRVNGAFRRLKVRRQADAIRAEPPPLPGNGPYRVITADPPWPYEVRQEDPSHRGAVPYPTMSIDQICAMGDEVRRIAHEDCLLLLWTTNFFMRHAHLVAEAWGFEEKTIVTWFKDEMGTGDILRGQTEHFIVALRGKPTVVLTNETTALFGKVRGHSVKPEEFYTFVEKWAPAPRYAYLFSRCLRDGWDGHGDEYPSDAEVAS
jgi:N6-adenosine-specific RNA methylase IME4